MKKIKILLAFCAALLLSCGDEFPEIDFAERARGYGYRYCIFPKDQMCIEGLYALCPSGGALGNFCPYPPQEGLDDLESFGYCVFPKDWGEGGMCIIGPFKACPGGGILSNDCLDEYDYCIFAKDQMCLDGPYRVCSSGGALSNNCPYEREFSASGEEVYHEYCVFEGEEICLKGMHSKCPSGGRLSDDCPYLPSSSSEVVPSSSSEDISSSSGEIFSSSSDEPSSSSIDAGDSSSSEDISSSSEEIVLLYACQSPSGDCTEATIADCLSTGGSITGTICQEPSSSSEEPSSSSGEISSSSEEESSSSGEEPSSSSSVPMCGEKEYDPNTENCCANSVIHPQTLGLCTGGIVQVPCGNTFYNYSTEFCDGGKIIDKCGGSDYSPSNEFCYADPVSGDEVRPKCNGQTYESPIFCYDNILYDICGSNPPHNTATHFCYGNSEVRDLCGGKPYTTAEFCEGNILHDFCGLDSPHNIATHFCDTRDNTLYKWVGIGEQIWMAENLNYDISNSSSSQCYLNIASNCDKYGRLYSWETAKTVCPSGWYLPSKAEWEELSATIEEEQECSSCDARHLKATSGWNSNGNGLDSYGFAALPGGNGNYYGSTTFGSIGILGMWWTSESSTSGNNAYHRNMSSTNDKADGYDYGNSHLLSVRCLKD